MNSKDLKTYFEWDTISWSRSMKIWEKYLRTKRDCFALEIGSRGGGLSLMLAKELDMRVVCSDLKSPKKTAQELHANHKTKHCIRYQSIDCTQIPYPENSFDLVIFKSVIGALGSFEKQQLAFDEMYRILKPGGVLLFAENLEASPFHMYLRRKFNRWSEYWRYPKLADMNLFINKFTKVQLDTTGFFATLVRTHILRIFLSYFDLFFEITIPLKLRYIVFGAAVK